MTRPHFPARPIDAFAPRVEQNHRQARLQLTNADDIMAEQDADAGAACLGVVLDAPLPRGNPGFRPCRHSPLQPRPVPIAQRLDRFAVAAGDEQAAEYFLHPDRAEHVDGRLQRIERLRHVPRGRFLLLPAPEPHEHRHRIVFFAKKFAWPL
nr:hypothetical protein [Paenibacillus cymbidii]